MEQTFEMEAAETEMETSNLITYVAALLYLLKDSGRRISNIDLLAIHRR
jgi:hypothetical protein